MRAMAKLLALLSMPAPALPSPALVAELLRRVLVAGCALALILAGPAVPSVL